MRSARGVATWGAICVAMAGTSWADGIGFEPGQRHPNFALPRVDGRWGGLAEHLGRKLLVFHFASW